MKFKIQTAFILLILSIIGSCAKDKTVTISTENKFKDIYFAGSEGNDTKMAVAKYWNNGKSFELSGKGSAEAQSIFVTGVDVYAVGNDTIGAKYWKNGAEVYLTGQGVVKANAIYVSGTDVYIAGSDDNGAKYWKNGVEYNLQADYRSRANSIFIDGTNVYIAGSDYDTKGYLAVYWKNGIEKKIVYSEEVTSIFVYNSYVFIAGHDNLSGPGYSRAKYWKNDAEYILSNDQSESKANSIYVSGGDVYVAGLVHDTAVYWKNGVRYNLTTSSPTDYYIIANSISVVGTDVYVAGTANIYLDSKAKYWKNGVEMDLGVYHSSRPSRATSIFVKN